MGKEQLLSVVHFSHDSCLRATTPALPAEQEVGKAGLWAEGTLLQGDATVALRAPALLSRAWRNQDPVKKT